MTVLRGEARTQGRSTRTLSWRHRRSNSHAQVSVHGRSCWVHPLLPQCAHTCETGGRMVGLSSPSEAPVAATTTQVNSALRERKA